MGRADERLLKIGKFARLTGGGYRLYGPEEAARLAFVKRAQRLGLSLDEIKELTDLINDAAERRLSLFWKKRWSPAWPRPSRGWPN